MRKKILSGITLLAISAVAAWNVNFNDKSDLSSTFLTNIEALAEETSSTGNTGPGSVVDCAGWGTGTKKLCLCTVKESCTESPCS
jgi:hypothetical protein